MVFSKGDTKIARTKKKLYASLLHMMKSKAFEEIRVCDICDDAQINRSTFYAHFDDKYMLFDEMIRDLQERLKEELLKNTQVNSLRDYYMELITLLLGHFEQEREIYSAIIVNNRNSVAMDMIYEAVNDDILKQFDKVEMSLNDVPKEMMVKFYLGAIFNLSREWLLTSKYSKEDIISYLDKLLPNY